MPDSITDQIEEMENLITANTVPPGTDPPGTDAPGTQAAATDPPATDPPSTDAPGTNAPGSEPPATDAPTTDAPDERDTELAELRRKVEKLEGDKTPKTSAPTTEVPLTVEEANFLDELGDDVDLDDLFRDKDSLNKLLNIVYKKGIETARKVLGEGVLRQIPDIVKHNIVTTRSLKDMSDKFYKDNDDLKGFKKVVGAVFEEVASANPDWTYEKAMTETGTETRKRLGLEKQAKKKTDNNNNSPRLHRKKGGPRQRGAKPPTDPFLNELSDMDKALDS